MKTDNKSICTLFIIMAATALCGCGDDIETGGESAYKGRTVIFSAGAAAQTRTVFGDDTSAGRTLLWHNNDMVFISCAQAARGTVTYTKADGTETTVTGVKPWADYAAETTSDNVHTAFGVPSGEAGTTADGYGIRWSDAETGYYFYSFYPSEFVENGAESTSSIVITVPGEQKCALPQGKDADGVWRLTPDMRHNMMWGRTLRGGAIAPVSAGQKVELEYKPVSSVLDITVVNSSGIAQREMTAVGAAVSGGANRLSGEFRFDMESGAIIPASGNQTTVAKARFVDAGGGNASVTLPADGSERLNACVFMPLSADVDGSDVTLRFYYNGTNVAAATPKEVRLSASAGRAVRAGKVTKVTVTLYPSSIKAEIVSIEDWADDAGAGRVVD